MRFHDCVVTIATFFRMGSQSGDGPMANVIYFNTKQSQWVLYGGSIWWVKFHGCMGDLLNKELLMPHPVLNYKVTDVKFKWFQILQESLLAQLLVFAIAKLLTHWFAITNLLCTVSKSNGHVTIIIMFWLIYQFAGLSLKDSRAIHQCAKCLWCGRKMIKFILLANGDFHHYWFTLGKPLNSPNFSSLCNSDAMIIILLWYKFSW